MTIGHAYAAIERHLCSPRFISILTLCLIQFGCGPALAEGLTLEVSPGSVMPNTRSELRIRVASSVFSGSTTLETTLVEATFDELKVVDGTLILCSVRVAEEGIVHVLAMDSHTGHFLGSGPLVCLAVDVIVVVAELTEIVGGIPSLSARLHEVGVAYLAAIDALSREDFREATAQVKVAMSHLARAREQVAAKNRVLLDQAESRFRLLERGLQRFLRFLFILHADCLAIFTAAEADELRDGPSRIERVENAGNLARVPALTRIFPDRSRLDDPTDRSWVELRGQLLDPQTKAPKASHETFLMSVDPDDPATNGKIDENKDQGNDNRGLYRKEKGDWVADVDRSPERKGFPGLLADPTIEVEARPGDEPLRVMTDDQGMFRVTLRVTFQPGDDFHVVVGCSLEEVKALAKRVLETPKDLSDSEKQATSPRIQVWRRLHLELDSMGPVVTDQNRKAIRIDNVQELGKVGDKHRYSFELKKDAGPMGEEEEYENGDLFLGASGLGSLSLVISTSRNFDFEADGEIPEAFLSHINTQGATEAGFDATVKDDDQEEFLAEGAGASSPNIPEPFVRFLKFSTSVFENFLLEAHVVPIVLDQGQQEADSTTDVPFDLNVEPSEALAQTSRPKNLESRFDFWVAYAQGAFQGPAATDDDPDQATGADYGASPAANSTTLEETIPLDDILVNVDTGRTTIPLDAKGVKALRTYLDPATNETREFKDIDSIEVVAPKRDSEEAFHFDVELEKFENGSGELRLYGALDKSAVEQDESGSVMLTIVTSDMHSSLIYFETIRDGFPADRLSLEIATTTLHEVVHQLGGRHGDGGLMDDTGLHLGSETIRRIRGTFLP